MSNSTPQDLMSTTAAAKFLNVDPATVRRWASIGKLPAYRIVGRLRISRADLAALVKPVEPDSSPRPLTRSERERRDAETDATLRAFGVR